jgi:hypothetical protein
LVITEDNDLIYVLIENTLRKVGSSENSVRTAIDYLKYNHTLRLDYDGNKGISDERVSYLKKLFKDIEGVLIKITSIS